MIVPVAVMIGLVVACAGCGGEPLTAQSSCRDYVSADRAAQQEAVQQVAQDNRAAYSVLTQNNVDARCSVRPDNTILWAITGEGDDAAQTDEPQADATETATPQEPDATDASEFPTEEQLAGLLDANPCIRNGVCGDAAFITCSDRISADLEKKCKALGIPYACGCYHAMLGDEPAYWTRPE